ncbi:TPA: mandelate racemase/muconate lactonizing enzyme family protein [Enterobacter hormaechei subsp. steigerwaltii]|nr:mandelate racemase/muconate lactonizing enzyme family protein [Enterobacter hormaechei subsp. steigerwaltii]HAV1789081.1 mandelate racemase/muconate lactonizing enzyme family protein [Enterobacter hormaechei subsp. xiangfangensis]
MKVTKVETLEIDLSGQNGLALWRPIFARIYTDEGITGIGEAGLAYGTASESVAPMMLKLAERFLIGKDPNNTETLWEHMLRRSFWAQGGGPVIFGAMSALDSALWDIKGKTAGLPVHRLLGAETPEPLRCYASQLHFGWESESQLYDKPSDYLKTAQEVRAEGYDCVKVCPVYVAAGGERARKRAIYTPAERKLARARMEAIREGVGPDTDIIIELNALTTTASSLQLINLFADLDILFVEEPTHYNSPEAHLKVANQSPIPMATGERLYTRWGFLPYLQAGGIDMIQPDIGLVGGISEGMKIAHLAHTFDVGVQAHICGTPLATAMALQFEAAIPNFEIHEHHSFSLKACNRELFEEDLQPVNGRFAVPTAPGFGMTLRKEAEDRMTIMSTR